MSINPWLPAPTPTSAAEQPAVIEVRSATGPMAPQQGVLADSDTARLPFRDQSFAAELWWMGAHGGAGESALAALVPGWAAADHAWPWTLREDRARVVVTARSNASGLRAAQAAAIEWAAGLVPFVEIVGLVVIADAPGRQPRPLRDLARLVGGGFPRTWSLPWIEAWRLGEPVSLSTAPREVRQLVAELRTLLGPDSEGTSHD